VKEVWGETFSCNKRETIMLPHLISGMRVQLQGGKTTTIKLYESKKEKNNCASVKTINCMRGKHASTPDFQKEGASIKGKMTTINLWESKEGKNCASMKEEWKTINCNKGKQSCILTSISRIGAMALCKQRSKNDAQAWRKYGGKSPATRGK